jgi:hypothetical protein
LRSHRHGNLWRTAYGEEERLTTLRLIIVTGSLLAVWPWFSAAQTSPGSLQISPASIDFGENSVDSDSAPRVITVTNSTPSPIVFEQIIASGIDFSEKHDCGQTLAPGGQCAIKVFFTPAIQGPRTGNLEIMTSDGTPHFVALNGTGK